MWQKNILTEQDMYNLRIKRKIDKSVNSTLEATKKKLYSKWTNYDELKKVQDKYDELLKYFYSYRIILMCEFYCLAPLIYIFISTFFSKTTFFVGIIILFVLFLIYKTSTKFEMLKKHLLKIKLYLLAK